MPVKLTRLIIFIMLTSLFQGCILNKQSFTKDTLKNEGIVVAEILLLSMTGGVSKISGVPRFESGEIPNSMKDDGHMVVSLPPGKHTLQSVRRVTGSLTTTYSINLEFDVRAGSMTNLGKLILLMEDERASTRYRIISVENNRHMLKYVRDSFPEVFGSIGNEVVKPEFKQLASRDIDKFQIEIARRKMVFGQNTVKLDSRNYIAYGGLGTLVRFTMSDDLKNLKKLKR